MSNVLAEPVLVGRERELEELFRYLDSAADGKGRTVLVSGEAGAGKTRLTNEFLKAVRAKEMNVLSGWCLSNAVTPYFPFVEAFKSHYSATDGENIQREGLEINAWLTGLKQAKKSETYRNLTPQGWKDQTFEVVSKTLQSISNEKPLVLFLEDIHWADSASLALLHYISRTVGAERILVLATFRGEELTTDVDGYGHPLAEELRLMRRENLVTEIQLTNLDHMHVTEIAENMIGGKITPELAQQLGKESGGNALFVVESLRMLFERGNLYQQNGQWRLTIDIMGIPDKIKDVILRRLSRLKFNHRRAVDAASVIGEKFDVDLLSSVLNLDSLEVLEDLNTIARSTSLIRVEKDSFRFDHAKSREAVYDEIALPLKKGYHKRVAQKLESTEKGGKLPLDTIAYHYAAAGIEVKAVEFSLAAGQEALSRFSNAEAIKHFDYVVQTLDDFPKDAPLVNTALEGLGDAYYVSCNYKKAIEVFERLAAAETGKVRLRAYRKALDAVWFGFRDKEHLLALARKAEPYAAYDRVESARIRYLKSTPLEPTVERKKEVDAVLQVFEEEYSIPDVARATSFRSLSEAFGKLAKESLSDSLRSLAMIRELYGDSRELQLTTTTSGQVFLTIGLLQEALSKYIELLRIAEKIGHYSGAALACIIISKFLEVSGKIEEALAMTMKGKEYFEKTDGVWRQDRVYSDFARQYSKLGDLPRAEEYIRLLANKPQVLFEIADPEGLLNKRDLLRSQAVFFAATNQWQKAYGYLAKALENAERTPVFVRASKIFVKSDYAWVLKKQGRTEEAQDCLEEIQRIQDEVEQEFAHVDIDAHLLVPWNVVAGEEFEMRIYLINISRKTGILSAIKELLPPQFRVIAFTEGFALNGDLLDLQQEKIGPFELKMIELRLKATNAGVFSLHPRVTFIDESGEGQESRSNEVTITVKPSQPKFEVLPGRVTTGSDKIDALLFGGIPKGYAIALVSQSVDEKKLVVQKFLDAEIRSGGVSFLIAAEAGHAAALSQEYPSNLFLLVCNLQVDSIIKDAPNVFKLKGVESLTEIDIALTKAFRTMPTTPKGERRICIDIISDVLLQHHALRTRKWLSGLLTNLKSKGFTTLAVLNPQMHPPEEIQAILSLFDGEVTIAEKDTPKGVRQTLRIKRLFNQRFSDEEIILDRGKLEQ